MKLIFFESFGFFMLKMLMMHVVCFSGLLVIHLSLRTLVVYLDIHFLILVHFMLDLIMHLFDVSCVNLLTMKLICALIMHAILNLTLYHPGIVLMLL